MTEFQKLTSISAPTLTENPLLGSVPELPWTNFRKVTQGQCPVTSHARISKYSLLGSVLALTCTNFRKVTTRQYPGNSHDPISEMSIPGTHVHKFQKTQSQAVFQPSHAGISEKSLKVSVPALTGMNFKKVTQDQCPSTHMYKVTP